MIINIQHSEGIDTTAWMELGSGFRLPLLFAPFGYQLMPNVFISDLEVSALAQWNAMNAYIATNPGTPKVSIEGLYVSPYAFPARLPNGIFMTDGPNLIGASVPLTLEIDVIAAKFIEETRPMIGPWSFENWPERPAAVVAYIKESGKNINGSEIRSISTRFFPILWVEPAAFSQQLNLPESIRGFVGTFTAGKFIVRNAGVASVNGAFGWSILPNSSTPGVGGPATGLGPRAIVFCTQTWQMDVIPQAITGQLARIGIHHAVPLAYQNSPYNANPATTIPEPFIVNDCLDAQVDQRQVLYSVYPNSFEARQGGYTPLSTRHNGTTAQSIKLFALSGGGSADIVTADYAVAEAQSGLYASTVSDLYPGPGIGGITGVFNLGFAS